MEDQAPAAPNEPNARPPRNPSNRKKRTAMISRGSPLQHEAGSLRADHSATISIESQTNHHPRQQNGNVPGASFEPAGVFERAPIRDEVHTFSSPPPREVRSKPTKQLLQAKIVHSLPNQTRIAMLCNQEQKAVTVDGGNTVSSQLRVLGSIEGLSYIDGTNRIWTESTKIGRDKKRKTVYHCSQQGCLHQDSTAQKARQHFVACHVKGAGWRCPINRCPHTRKHKRLDDLKNHHMVPEHDTKYYRGRESSEPLSNSLATLGSTPLPYASPASNSRTQDHQRGPHRTNPGGATRTARNAHRHAGPLNMNLRPRRNTTTSMTAAEQEESQGHAPDIPHISRSQPPTPGELNYQAIVDSNSFLPSIAPIEGVSRSTPVLAALDEPSSAFSPTPSHTSLFDDPAGRQVFGPPHGRYPSSAQTRYDMEGPSPATHTPMPPHYARPGSHVSPQSHTLYTHYAHDEEVARMRRRDGQPGHDPPVQVSINARVSNSSSFPPPPGSPYAQWRPQQQPLLYGGAHGTLSHSHLPQLRIETPRNYAAVDKASQLHPHSWTSYPFDGSNVHDYGQPSTSYQSPRGLSNTSPSIPENYGYPSNQVLSPSYGAFPFPNRVDEWPPNDEPNLNPDGYNFGDYESRPEDYQPQS